MRGLLKMARIMPGRRRPARTIVGPQESLAGMVISLRSGWLLLALLFIPLLGGSAWAAPKTSAKAPAIEGPLGQETGRVTGEGVLTLKIIPDKADEPVITIGRAVRVQLTAAATSSVVAGHPFEIFVAVTPLTADDTPDLTQVFARCGTIHAEGTPAIPAKAISVTSTKPAKGRGEGRATYSVAETPQIAVGLLDIPRLFNAVGVGAEGRLELPATAFSLALEKNGTLRFYAESPSKNETLAVMVEVSEWHYTHPPGV